MRRRLSLILPLLLSACSPLGAFNALVPQDRGVRLVARDVAYGREPRQRLDVYVPRGEAEKGGRLILVFFYGGSWSSGDKNGYGFAGRAFAAQGFVTIVPDYRLVPAIRYPEFLRDSAAAVRWARANAARFGGDPDRVVLAGHSAGAYNAAMLAMDPQWLGTDRAAVRGWAGLAGPYDFLPFDLAVTRATFGGWDKPADTQPITHAGAGDPPALLLSGGEDDLVGAHNARNLAAALAQAGVPVEAKSYGGVGHIGMVTALATLFRGKAPVLRDVAAFAKRVSDTGPVSTGATPTRSP